MISSSSIPVFLVALVILFSSCTTYYIPVESFKQQFARLDTAGIREVTAQGPLGGRTTYTTYSIDTIRAIDKKGNQVILKNSPSMEIRITDTADSKTIFYLDLIRFDGKNITGRTSRILSSISKTIPIDAVKKIEVQNGRKNFRYVK